MDGNYRKVIVKDIVALVAGLSAMVALIFGAMAMFGDSGKPRSDAPKHDIDFGESVLVDDSVDFSSPSNEPSPIDYPQSTDYVEPLCRQIVIVTYPPECPPCRKLDADAFEKEIADTFGCVVNVDENPDYVQAIPFASITTIDGAIVECLEFYDPALPTRGERLRFVLASIASAIEKYEVEK